MKNVFEAAHRKVVCELVDEDRLEDDCHESSQCHDRRNSVMVKRHPTALLLSSTLTIPLLLGGKWYWNVLLRLGRVVTWVPSLRNAVCIRQAKVEL